MNQRPLINLGDLLTACTHMGAADANSVRTIARMLGLSEPDEGMHQESQEPAIPRQESTTTVEEPSLPPRSSTRPLQVPTSGAPLTIQEVKESGPMRRAPELSQKKLQLPPPEVSRRNASLELEPLFRPTWTRNIIAGAVATHRPEGPLLLDELLKRIGERRPIERLPRQLRSTLRAGAQVLVDRSETMEPFSADVRFLIERIHAVVGRELAQVLSFEGSPQRTGVGSRSDWREHRFQPGMPILALTCFDLNAAPHRALASALAWRKFADAARNAQCLLVAFVPYPPSRWPEGLAERMVIVEWDRGTTVGYVRRSLRQRNRIP